MQKFIGTGVALITPFKKDLSVDFLALAKLVEFNIINGINYLVINGTTGESATISKKERRKIIEVVAKTNQGRLPLVLGIGGNNTTSVIEEILSEDLSHIDAILSVAPYYNKPTQEGFYRHFEAIAKASPKPIILYNVPGRTSKNMQPSTTIRLANNFSNIIAVKEAGNNVQQYLELIKNKPKDFLVISGDDMTALSLTLAGASGVISVIGQGFPTAFSEMIRLGLNRKVDQAFQTLFQMTSIIDMIFEQGNPAGIKQVFQSLGIANNTVRLPLVKVDESLANRIDQFVQKSNK
mgnify:CR=1 FL=1